MRCVDFLFPFSAASFCSCFLFNQVFRKRTIVLILILILISTDTDTEISPECAAVLLIGGASSGVVVALASSPLLAAFGFTFVGIQAGSFASWWQSTLPLVSAGSLFAYYLQSIAMSGAMVSGTLTTLGSLLGSAAAATKVKEFCKVVDSVNKNSFQGKKHLNRY